MRVLVRHGHFAFFPRNSEELGRFIKVFDLEIVKEQDFYTFPRLQNAPEYSLQGLPYQTFPALKTFEGKAWEVMRENGWVYHLESGILLPKESVVAVVNLPQVGYFYLAPGVLIQPGVFNAFGKKIMSYDGEWVPEKNQLQILEVGLV